MKINNYMDLIQVRYNHSSWQLFKGYLKGVKTALDNKDLDTFKLYRKGFEVLRDEDSFEAYHRIYRKYILKQKLNYPSVKEKQLIEQYQLKEKNANEYVDSYKNQLPSYTSYVSKMLIRFIGFDLIQIFAFGGSGLLFCGIGIWAMLHNGNADNLIGGSIAILAGLFFSRRNFNYFIRS